MRTPSMNRSARFSPYVAPTPKAEKFHFGIEGLEEDQQLCPLYGAFRNMNFSPENRRLFDPLENDPLFQVCLLEMFTVMNLKECALTEEVLMLYIHVFLLVFVGDLNLLIYKHLLFLIFFIIHISFLNMIHLFFLFFIYFVNIELILNPFYGKLFLLWINER
jgi:hypothetical protein